RPGLAREPGRLRCGRRLPTRSAHKGRGARQGPATRSRAPAARTARARLPAQMAPRRPDPENRPQPHPPRPLSHRHVSRSPGSPLSSTRGRRMNVALVVFAKPPLRGRVKTRMHGALTPEAAARMYEAGLRDIVARVRMLGISVQIAYVDMPGGDGFFAAAFPDIPRFAQVGSDLGARMAAAIERLFRSGRDAVVIVGADVPTLPIAYLEEAL